MGKFVFRALAGVLTAGAISSAALAADMPAPPVLRGPPPPPPVVEEFGGWYLRGDVGVGATRVGDVWIEDYNLPGANYTLRNKSASEGFSIGGGVGYSFGFVRVDMTGEYRGGARLSLLDSYPAGATWIAGSNDVKANLASAIGLFNAYVDLGTWWCITPYVGAGIGGARHTVSGLTDVNTPVGGSAYAPDHTSYSLAWALHAGLAFDITPNLKLDVGYRYLNMGKATAGDLHTFSGVSTYYNAYQFKDLTSHDIKVGLRWQFANCAGCAAPPPVPVAMPVIRKY